jgi:hypothetical protein
MLQRIAVYQPELGLTYSDKRCNLCGFAIGTIFVNK